MKSDDLRDLRERLNKELDMLVPEKPDRRITETPVNTVKKENKVVKATNKQGSNFFRSRAFAGLCACFVCIAVVLGIVFPVFFGNNNPENNTTAYVSLDLNPSVDYVVDKNDKVVNVISKNNDGDILLAEGFRDTLIGKDISSAVSMTVEQATKLGFVDVNAGVPDASGQVNKYNAMRITATSDDMKKAEKVAENAGKGADGFFRTNGIYMVVYTRAVDKSKVVGDTESVNAWNSVMSAKNSYYYINNAEGATEEELAEKYKNDFMLEHIADSLEELFEDIEEIAELLAEMNEINNEIISIYDSTSIVFTKDYWDVKEAIANGEVIDGELAELVEEMEELLKEYNEEVTEINPESIISLSDIFSPIENSIEFGFAVEFANLYLEYSEDIEELVDELSEDIRALSKLLNVISIVFEEIQGLADEISNIIEGCLNEVSLKFDEYVNLCDKEIDRMYNDLYSRYGSILDGSRPVISESDYESYIENMMDIYGSYEDLWNSIHSTKRIFF